MKFLPLLFLCSICYGQAKLPLIRATSNKVSIRDGAFLDKNRWTLTPKARPDIFTADRTRETKWVTFYTDIDSIRVKVKPGTIFDFIILLNGKDSCYTQIASAIAPPSIDRHTDTIPFTLTAEKAIRVKAVVNGKDTINLHFDTGSFDVRITRDALKSKVKLPIASLQMGTLLLNHPTVIPTGLTAGDLDGRFGYNLFEGKTVEIDNVKHVLIIRPDLPSLKGYSKVKLDFIRSFICVKGSLLINNKKFFGEYLMDTGSGQSLIADSAWAANTGMASLKLLKSSTISDPRGVKYQTNTYLAPEFKLAEFNLHDIPVMVFSGKNPVGFPVNYIGNGLMENFDLIFDFRHDVLYFKPINHNSSNGTKLSSTINPLLQNPSK